MLHFGLRCVLTNLPFRLVCLMYIYILKIYSYILCDLHFSDKWLSVSNMADFQVSARNTEGGKGLLKYRQDSVM